MYDLGIIGGMGPKATAEFLTRIIEYTNASCDQEHISICLLNNPKMPERTNYLKHNAASPLKYLNISIGELKEIGIKVLVMPCNSAHFYVDQLNIPDDIIFINMIKETMLYIDQHFPTDKLLILGTQIVKSLQLYENYNNVTRNNINILYPSDNEQNQIIKIIHAIKAGENDLVIVSELLHLIDFMQEEYQYPIILIACTELSCYSKYLKDNHNLIDSMDILAIKAIETCGYKTNQL